MWFGGLAPEMYLLVSCVCLCHDSIIGQWTTLAWRPSCLATPIDLDEPGTFVASIKRSKWLCSVRQNSANRDWPKEILKDLLRPFPIERFSGPMRNCKTRRKTHEQAFEACADVFEGKALRNQHISSSKVMNPRRKTLWNQFTKKSTTSQSSNRYASLARRLLSSMTDNLTLLRNRMGMNRQSSFLGIANTN